MRSQTATVLSLPAEANNAPIGREADIPDAPIVDGNCIDLLALFDIPQVHLAFAQVTRGRQCLVVRRKRHAHHRRLLRQHVLQLARARRPRRESVNRLLPDASQQPSGENASEYTQPVCPFSTRTASAAGVALATSAFSATCES